VLALHRQQVASLASALAGRFQQRLHRHQDRLARVGAMLRLLSPEHTIGRGYSITMTAGGKLVRAITDVEIGAELETRLRDGKLFSVVNSKTSTRTGGGTKREPRK
jgi:exodeoxyribonuclease VII large subunit